MTKHDHTAPNKLAKQYNAWSPNISLLDRPKGFSLCENNACNKKAISLKISSEYEDEVLLYKKTILFIRQQ